MTGFPVVVDFGSSESFEVSFDGDFSVDFSQMHEAGEYSGAYEFTPSAERQEIPTADKILTQNIIINPIPSNYGLIEWNGQTLSVR